jgi:hypothetical protein
LYLRKTYHQKITREQPFEQLGMKPDTFKKHRQKIMNKVIRYEGGKINRYFRIEQTDESESVVDLGERLFEGDEE